MAVVLLVLAAGVLERAGWLPEPVAEVVHGVEGWVEALLREAGIEPSGTGRPQAEPGSSGDQIAVAQAVVLLDAIPVRAERPRGYEREDWPHWRDADHDCRNARQEVLAEESLERVRWSANGCRVTGGLWRGAYTGEVVGDPGELDVDHLVPLAEAYRSGGYGWDRERRAAYANDLGDGRTLIAVGLAANRSKGGQGPEAWLPPQAGYRCRYAADWVAVKARWGLSVDERERVALGHLLESCARP